MRLRELSSGRITDYMPRKMAMLPRYSISDLRSLVKLIPVPGRLPVRGGRLTHAAGGLSGCQTVKADAFGNVYYIH